MPRRAHPRVCGENRPLLAPYLPLGGSSPRVRGKLFADTHREDNYGLIPACAGKTLPRYSICQHARAHPRVCGENLVLVEEMRGQRGSSPRVRGKRGEESRRDSLSGLIPACAGKTQCARKIWSATWAHPRVCGENEYLRSGSKIQPGSSPRVRGKPILIEGNAFRSGLIPACAGKTKRYLTSVAMCRAHPRVCGENDSVVILCLSIAGSSPRVRGKRGDRERPCEVLRLIPACAGKTERGWKPFPHGRAHPRVCGENEDVIEERDRCAGSSPRVRGKPLLTLPGSVTGLAHPRVCGENLRASPQTTQVRGSSPRVRGKRGCHRGARSMRGLIPACAGKTAIDSSR